AELVVLAEAALLHPVVAEHGQLVPDLHRLRLVVQAVLEVRPHHAGGALRAQRQVAVAAVLEAVHLLAHHVRAEAGGAPVDAGVLEGGRDDLEVAGRLEHPPGLVEDRPAQRRPRPVPVERTPRRLELAAHARSSCRNGFDSRSWPSVVAGPWPGRTIVSGG